MKREMTREEIAERTARFDELEPMTTPVDREVVNLGFSGNGRLELPLCELLCELEAACFVIDCLPSALHLL